MSVKMVFLLALRCLEGYNPPGTLCPEVSTLLSQFSAWLGPGRPKLGLMGSESPAVGVNASHLLTPQLHRIFSTAKNLSKGLETRIGIPTVVYRGWNIFDLL